MCLKPAAPHPIPPATVAIAKGLFPEGSIYQFIGDVLFDQFRDQDFTDLYPADGQPAISPVLLSFVLIFQALENLSDRKTVYALRSRFDWKYALHLEPDYKGFDHTVLVEFRQRLLQHEAESRMFNAIFAQLKQLGFYKQRGIQRTDSMAIYSHHRDLKRIELCSDTVRVAIKELLHIAPEWTRATLPMEWEERYAKRCKSERMDEAERTALSVVVGDDGQWLLDTLAQANIPELRDLRAAESLHSVWAVHYQRSEDGHMHWTEGGDRGGAHALETPHDPDARWGTKRSSDWIGYKVQVTETDDPDTPHLITDIALTGASDSDMGALEDIRDRQAKQGTLPSERYVDSGYVSGANIAAARKEGEELIGPIRTTVTLQSKLPDALTHADFTVDFENHKVTCPAGHTATLMSSGTNGQQVVFRRADCQECALKARCYTGTKKGRCLTFGPNYHETQFARQRQQTPQFKDAYRRHRGGVEACLSALVRGPHIRVTRYDGQAKNQLYLLLVATGVNLARSVAWATGYRPKKYPPRLGLVVGGRGTGAAGAGAVAQAA